MLMISSLSIAFIKEAMIETHPVYLLSSPPAAIHHVYRHDNAISLTINYTGDETTLPYILDALTKPSIPVTLFLPVTLLNQHMLTTDAALDSEQIDDLIEWGGLINRKKETTFIEVPTNIHFLRQRYVTTKQLKQTLNQNIRPGDIIAIDLNHDLVIGTLLIQSMSDYLMAEGYQIIPLSELLFE